MVLHKDCGGKLRVLNSTQFQDDRGLKISRFRKCEKCGANVISIETIPIGFIHYSDAGAQEKKVCIQ